MVSVIISKEKCTDKKFQPSYNILQESQQTNLHLFKGGGFKNPLDRR